MSEKEFFEKYKNNKILQLDGKEYTLYKNAEAIIQGDCYDEQRSEGEYLLVVTADGKFFKVEIYEEKMKYDSISLDDAATEFYQDFEDDPDGDFKSVDEVKEYLSNLIKDLSAEKPQEELSEEEKRYREELEYCIKQLKKERDELKKRMAYIDKIFKKYDKRILELLDNTGGLFSDFPREKNLENPSYDNIKTMMDECFSYFIEVYHDDRKTKLFSGRTDILAVILKYAPIIGYKEILDRFLKCKRDYQFDDIDEQIIKDSIDRIDIYNAIYESIEPNIKYKRADFVKVISEKYPTLCSKNYRECKFYKEADILQFWEIHNKLVYEKKGNRIYFYKP